MPLKSNTLNPKNRLLKGVPLRIFEKTIKEFLSNKVNLNFKLHHILLSFLITNVI